MSVDVIGKKCSFRCARGVVRAHHPEEVMLRAGWIDDQYRATFGKQYRKEVVAAAVRAAEKKPPPPPEYCTTDVYA
jgi:TPP-dependent pyruvate/acetoin dehydrogenase alpha subunit